MTRKPFNPSLARIADQGPSQAPSGPVTVSQVTAMVRQAIGDALPGTLRVVGEISNFKRHGSGHLYLTLKDPCSELSCVMWRSAAAGLGFAPTDGLEVVATGHIEVFERTGRYQLYIRKLEPRGVGALELAFRQLYEKLSAEGMFDQSHKRQLPAYPTRIALVTSPTGAAVHDMLSTIQHRYPAVQVLVYPVRVQGPGAAEEIAKAVTRLNANASGLGGIDVMIVGRGGGSLEDLWAFNDERVARAVYKSEIPVISAVGHEVDVTIADLVADVRAATPTAAAEIAVPLLADVLGNLTGHQARLTRALKSDLALKATRLGSAVERGAFRRPLDAVHRREQLIDELNNRVHRSLIERTAIRRRTLDHHELTLERIQPTAVLLRAAVRLRDQRHRLHWAVSMRLAQAVALADSMVWRLERASPKHLLDSMSQRLEGLAAAMPAAVRHRFSLLHERIRRQESKLNALSHKSVLGRGFSVTRIRKGGQIVRSVKQVRDGHRVVTELADGRFESDVVNLDQLELFN
ncbi:MAG: exodeoxyribonuclease VII large subunit [Phycisphaerae bacterium]